MIPKKSQRMTDGPVVGIAYGIPAFCMSLLCHGNDAPAREAELVRARFSGKAVFQGEPGNSLGLMRFVLKIQHPAREKMLARVLPAGLAPPSRNGLSKLGLSSG